jgi:hypothetical protein
MVLGAGKGRLFAITSQLERKESIIFIGYFASGRSSNRRTGNERTGVQQDLEGTFFFLLYTPFICNL